MGDQATAFSVLMWLLVSSSALGWETICSQAGRQILAAGTWLQSLGSFQTKRHKAQPSLLPDTIALVSFISQAEPSSFCLLLGFFFPLGTHHILREKKKAYCLKPLFILGKKCLQGPSAFPAISANRET